jgi:hypothetical protein
MDLGGGYLFEVKDVVIKDIAAVRGGVFGSKVDWRGCLRLNSPAKRLVTPREETNFWGKDLGVDWFIVARAGGRSFDKIAEMVFSTSQL